MSASAPFSDPSTNFDSQSFPAYTVSIHQPQTIRKEAAIKVIDTAKAMQQHAEKMRLQGKTLAFVPTMGFLHKGHMSLLRIAKQYGDHVILSIFVNPTQFAPGEDLDAYPRSFEQDCWAAEQEGVDVVFAPQKEDLYAGDFETYVTLEDLPNHLCGLSRTTHFRGVATVVSKLFNIVKPHAAVFGEKDYQQLAVIRRMVRDLNFDITICGGPIVREADGLAMSSRNSYLSPEQRPAALSLSQSLQRAQVMVTAGETNAAAIIAAATAIIQAHDDTVIDYVAICDPDTLDDMTTVDRPAVMALAVKVGSCRLIDNRVLRPGNRR